MASLNGSAFLNQPTSGSQGGRSFLNQPGADQAVADLGLKDKVKEDVQDEEEKRKKMLEDFLKNQNSDLMQAGKAGSESSMSAVAALFG